MIEINWSDVISTLQNLKSYLIVLGVVAVLAIIATIAGLKLPKAAKYMIRWQAWIGFVVVLAVVVNLILTGPMYTLVSLASGSGSITEESSAMSLELGQRIAEEGVVVLQNDNNTLPYSDDKNLNVFGWASVAPCYGGTGSGALNDAYHIVDLIEGLQNAGFNTNTELSDFYKAYRAERPGVGMWAQDWTLPEPSADTYSSELISNAERFSKNAIIVLTRTGGEHIDLPRSMDGVNYTNNSDSYEDFPAGTNYLGLSQSERSMIDLVCSHFDGVTVVINSANTMELGWVKEFPQITGVVWCPGTGQNGFNGLGEILIGAVNPSGRAADTFVNDLTQTPTWNTFAEFEYDNMEEFRVSADDAYMPNSLPHFINYSEGIYVGYRFYETAAAEGLIDYDDVVAYPFGHGLSYTTFSQEMGPISESRGQITFDVTVTNTGSMAGKDVVEVYFNPPYTNGGIEKSSVNLVAFDKTGLLEPGASQVLTISFAVEDMASYDAHGAGCYVVEQGDYIISINSDSHTVLDAQTYTVSSTMTYGEGNRRSTDQIAAVNQFAFAEGDVVYLSRADGFANYAEAAAAPASMSMGEEAKTAFTNNSNWAPTDDGSAMPTTGAKNGVTATDVIGKPYDDPQWEQLLDNLTISDMQALVALGGYQTPAAESVGKAATTDCDGPAAINNNFTQVGSIGFPANVMVANTWNEDIAREFGDCIGRMADEMDVSGWYAPSINMHRNAFSGRNFEYYSEDGLLAGKMASQSVQGADAHGVYAYLKHFALNEMETNRWGMLCTWSTEQAIRESYLKPFEICVKDNTRLGGAAAGYPLAIMTSYNYIGNQWAGACSNLLNSVLRDEWGFRGLVLTDYFASFGYMDATRSIYYGGSSCLSNRDVGTNYVTDTSAATVTHMRNAAHDILYTTINSRAHLPENLSAGLMSWQIILIVVDVLLAAAVIALELFVVRKGYAKRKG